MKEIPEDILKECEGEIRDRLFTYAWPHIRRGLTRGFPEYYKDLLLRRQFELGDLTPRAGGDGEGAHGGVPVVPDDGAGVHPGVGGVEEGLVVEEGVQ
jgi:hypothetical protein